MRLCTTPRRTVYISLITIILWAITCFAQVRNDEELRLPNGKPQREEILKADHQKSVEDAGELLRLAEEFKIELEKNERHVISVSSIRKLEEIEKLSKRIKSRLKRF